MTPESTLHYAKLASYELSLLRLSRVVSRPHVATVGRVMIRGGLLNYFVIAVVPVGTPHESRIFKDSGVNGACGAAGGYWKLC